MKKGEENICKFLCSYDGRIMPRLTDGKLRYVGGHTRVLSVHRSISFTELMVKLGDFCGSSVQLTCQLPDGDLETLVSITSDEDLRLLMAEYDKASIYSFMKIRAVLSLTKGPKSISTTHSPVGYYSRPITKGADNEVQYASGPNGGNIHRRSVSLATYFVHHHQPSVNYCIP